MISRELTIILGVVVVIGLSLLGSATARASGCTDSWKNAESGSWFTGSDWSKGAPPTSEEEACITASGTYTVTMTQTSGTVSVQSLTVGGASGTQTLAVGSSCSLNAILSSTAGLTNGANGVVVLTNGDGCGDSVTLSGPVENAGSIVSEPEHGGSRTLQGNLTNTGTLTFNANTSYNGASAVLTNEGAIDVAEGKQLAVSNKGSLTNAAKGSITGTGSGNVLMGSETSFTEGAGTTSGKEPVIVDDGSLTYNASGGEGPIALRGASSLSGSTSSGQTLAIQSTCGENVVATAATGFSNGGKITLVNGDGCGDSATLDISGGTLTNTGTLVTEVDHGGGRTLQGNIKNTGKLEIDAATAYNGASAVLTNEGAIDLAEATQLTVSNSGSVVNGTGGSITATGTGKVTMSSGTSFTEGAGTTSGAKPVVVDDGALTYTGAGQGLIALHGSSTLSGKLTALQSLLVESTCGENAVATAATSFTNNGTITLTNGDGCGNSATLDVSSGTLTNSGKLVTEVANGGTRTLEGNITNTGTLAIKTNTVYSATGTLLTNEGTINVGEGKQLELANGTSLTNGSNGKISASDGGVFLSTGTFTEGAGTTSGAEPVVIDDGTLDYTGTGASQLALHGSSTLSGNLASGQSLSIASTCSENAVATAAASFTNEGTITLTNGDGCGNSATLNTSSGTLTNSGKILTEPANGGSRTLEGNITNTGTITLNASTSDPTTNAIVLNEGAIDIANGADFSLSETPTVTNGSGGVIASAGTGALVQTSGTFNQGLGTTSGNVPVILDDLTLNYVEHGSGRLGLRGASSLNGTIRSGETLVIESTCGENALTTTTGSFENKGTLELTNGDGCGNSTTLNLKGGTLTNTSSGALNIDNPHGGTREIEGNVANDAPLGIAAGATLQVTGTYTQSSVGRFKTFIANASSYGVLSVTGTATIAGTLVLRPAVSFKGSLGQTYPVIKSASLSGTFASVSEAQIKYTGIYYKPTYSETGVTLLVAQATLVVAPKSVATGASTTVSGSGYLPGDTIALSFTDSKGVKTVYPSVTVSSSGEYSTEVAIPATAALGVGTITTTSTVTGVHIAESLKVVA